MKNKGNEKRNRIFSAFRLLGRYQPAYYTYMIPLILVTSVIPLAGVWLPKVIIEFLTEEKEYKQILAAASFYAGGLLLANTMKNFLTYRADLSVARFRTRLQLEIGRAAMNAQMKEIENARYQEEILLAGNVTSISDIMSILQNLFSAAITILGLSFIIVRVNILFFLLVGFTLGLKIFLSVLKFRFNAGLRREEAENDRVGGYLDYLQYYNEGAAKEVRINNAQNWMFGKIRDFRDRMVSIQLRAFGRYNLFEALQKVAVALQNIFILLALSEYYLEGELNIADFSLYFSSVTLLSSTLSGVTDQIFDFGQKLLVCGDFDRLICMTKDRAERNSETFEDENLIAEEIPVATESPIEENLFTAENSVVKEKTLAAEKSTAEEKTLSTENATAEVKALTAEKSMAYVPPIAPKKIATMANSLANDYNTTIKTITFENVSFSYPGSDEKVLRDVTFQLNQGDRAMLVGVNGSGKTTIIKLLCRFYEPDSGRICLDGRDIRTIPEKQYYSLIATVFQDFSLLSFPVSENISLKAAGEEDSARLWSCLKKAELDELMQGLKEKEATHISRLFSENGVEFSGGEKQRLGIARAAYKDARILVLDEPAASLDVKIEEELYRNFHSMTQGKISLTVSHRLSQASVCNKIFVLDKGVICEEGTHRELMDKCGVYAAMFRKQREAYIL